MNSLLENNIENELSTKVESNTNFIGWGIKDNFGRFINDKCVGIVNRKPTYISYKKYCQAVNGYISQSKADIQRNLLQQELDELGFDIELSITNLHNNEYFKKIDKDDIIILKL